MTVRKHCYLVSIVVNVLLDESGTILFHFQMPPFLCRSRSFLKFPQTQPLYTAVTETALGLCLKLCLSVHVSNT